MIMKPLGMNSPMKTLNSHVPYTQESHPERIILNTAYYCTSETKNFTDQPDCYM